MILVDKMKMSDERVLYDMYNPNERRISIHDRDINVQDILEVNDAILLFDPTVEELKLLIDLKKEVIVAFTMLPEKYLDLIKHDNILKVILFDDLDALFLDKRGVNKFSLVRPFELNDEVIISKKTDEISCAAICYDKLTEITMNDIHILESIPKYNLRSLFSGYKALRAKSDFQKLNAILYSTIILKEFPIFALKREIADVLYTVNFPSRFPVVAAFSSACHNIPLVFSNRYYKWILSELQNPTPDDMVKLTDEKYFSEIREKQYELFSTSFNKRGSYQEAIAEYVKSGK